MGDSSNLRRLLKSFAEAASKPNAAPSENKETPAAAKPSEVEVGLSGTVNWNGQIFSESNSKLQWARAYGTPGTSTWGEWEMLERSDHQVAAALNLLAAPIRDSEIEVCLPEEYEQALKPKAPKQDKKPLPSKDGKEVPLPKEFAAENAEKTYPEGAENPAEDDEGEADPDADPELLAEAERLKDIAEFVKENLEEWLEPKWPMLLEQIVRYGLGYGFSLHEIVWGIREDERVPGGQAVYVRKLAQRLPSSVKQDGWIEKDGELAVIRQTGVKDGRWYENLELPADKCVLATWNRTGNNYQGFSAFRPGWYMGKIRAELLRIMGIGSQREALGVPVATMDKETVLTDSQRDALQELLENTVYHENAGFQLPPGVKLEWFFSPAGNKGHVLEMWDRLGLAILELVQAQQQALGTGGTGSRAVGEVHDATKNAFIQGIRAWIESVFNGVGEQPYTGLIRKIVDLNFGPQKVYPKLKFVVKKAEIPAVEFANCVKTLSDAGALHLTEQDENEIRERIGLSPIDALERSRLEEEKKAEQAERMEALKQQAPPEAKLSELLDLE